jgi:flagellar biosynthetic protein FliR
VLNGAAIPLTDLLPAQIWVYSLVFARVGAMVMTMPIFGDTTAPQRVRVILALGLTLAIAPVSGIEAGPPPPPAQLTGLLIVETLAGLLTGIVARLLMSAVQVAATVIALQLGLSFATTVDPAQGGHGAVLSTFMSLLALVLIFSTDLHHLLIAAMARSYHLFPAGGAIDTGDAAQLAIGLTSQAFALGLQMAAPFLVFGLVFQITAGVVSRLMPQVQIFFLTVPLSILGGFTLLMFTLSASMELFLRVFSETLRPMAGG